MLTQNIILFSINRMKNLTQSKGQFNRNINTPYPKNSEMNDFHVISTKSGTCLLQEFPPLNWTYIEVNCYHNCHVFYKAVTFM